MKKSLISSHFAHHRPRDKLVTYYHNTIEEAIYDWYVTDRKLEYLTKGGELAGLALDGVLEEWEYFYLVKLDVDTASVALVGGQYYDDEEYFSLDDRHVIVALRHDDGSYDILCDDPINDGGDFFGYLLCAQAHKRYPL